MKRAKDRETILEGAKRLCAERVHSMSDFRWNGLVKVHESRCMICGAFCWIDLRIQSIDGNAVHEPCSAFLEKWAGKGKKGQKKKVPLTS